MNEVYDKFSTTFVFMLYSQKRMTFYKTIHHLDLSVQPKLRLGLGHVLITIIFAIGTSYSVLTGSGYKSWNLLCSLTEWPNRQKLGRGVCFVINRLQFLLFASLRCFQRRVQNISQKCWHIVSNILLMCLWAQTGAFSSEALIWFLTFPILKSQTYLLQKTHTHSPQINLKPLTTTLISYITWSSNIVTTSDQFLTRILVFIPVMALCKSKGFIFATCSTDAKPHCIKEHRENWS